MKPLNEKVEIYHDDLEFLQERLAPHFVSRVAGLFVVGSVNCGKKKV